MRQTISRVILCATATLLLGAPPLLHAQDSGQVSGRGTGAIVATAVGTRELLGLRRQLDRLVDRQEEFFSRHGSYTTDLLALGMLPSSESNERVIVLWAGGRSWAGISYLTTARRGPSCAVFVGELADFPEIPTTQVNGIRPSQQGIVACDPPQ